MHLYQIFIHYNVLHFQEGWTSSSPFMLSDCGPLECIFFTPQTNMIKRFTILIIIIVIHIIITLLSLLPHHFSTEDNILDEYYDLLWLYKNKYVISEFTHVTCSSNCGLFLTFLLFLLDFPLLSKLLIIFIQHSFL